jgi:hypothetical protein
MKHTIDEFTKDNYRLQLRCCGYDLEVDYDRKNDEVEVLRVDGLEPSEDWIDAIFGSIEDRLLTGCFRAANEEDERELAEQKEWDNFTYTHTYL